MAKREGPQWYMRLLVKVLGSGLTKKQAHNMLAGVGKHTRQRRRAIGYWARKRKRKRELRTLRRGVQRQMKANAKKKRNRKKKKGERKHV